MPSAVKRIREWFDMRSRLKKAELAVQTLEGMLRGSREYAAEHSRRANYTEQLYGALRRECSDLLEQADMLFAVLPKAPIPMSEILTWRSNYRQLRIQNQ